MDTGKICIKKMKVIIYYTGSTDPPVLSDFYPILPEPVLM